jgi:hypothetical protein
MLRFTTCALAAAAVSAAPNLRTDGAKVAVDDKHDVTGKGSTFDHIIIFMFENHACVLSWVGRGASALLVRRVGRWLQWLWLRRRRRRRRRQRRQRWWWWWWQRRCPIRAQPTKRPCV